jgi:uncharacterized protein (DUF169 family)
MDMAAYTEAAEFLRNDLRLRTQPIAVRFLKSDAEFPAKVLRPSVALGKRLTICQAVTMARLYEWTMGVTREDLICVPAMIAFGLTGASDQRTVLGKVFCKAGFAKDQDAAQNETASMSFLEKGKFQAIALSPLSRGLYEPHTVAIYGNPAQVMRMAQAWAYLKGGRVSGNFGGKVECSEYLIAPYATAAPRVAIPGGGDRIFSMTQDDEVVFALPGNCLPELVEGLKNAGKKIGARYPVTFYQNFQPEFPKLYKEVGDELGL